MAALPAAFVVSSLWLRSEAGPFYLWHVADPSYIYLFDGLNVATGTAPANFYHPGTPAQLFAGLVLRLAHPLLDTAELARDVALYAESFLRLISDVFVLSVAVAMTVAGAVIYGVMGRLLPALIVQSAPFLSMLTFKNAYHVKPEPLLIAATLALVTLTVAALWSQGGERYRYRYAAAFGLVAGFAVAAKLTAAPVFVLPLFVLWRWRANVVYLVFAGIAFFIFTLPIAGHYGDAFAYFAKIAVASGAYGQGTDSVIDLGSYPEAVAKLLKRPLLSVPLILLAAALIAAAWRRHAGYSVPRPAARAAAGVLVAILFHVLAVAKQPAAFYLVPSLVLGAFAIVATATLIADFAPWQRGSRLGGRWVLAAAFGALLIGQGMAVVAQTHESRMWRADAETFGDGRFARCAKVYFYAASEPAYALYLGDHVAGGRRGVALGDAVGADEYWLADFLLGRPHELRGRGGPVKLSEITADRPCTIFRGLAARGSMTPYIAAAAPSLVIRDICRAGPEIVMTAGIDCSGK